MVSRLAFVLFFLVAGTMPAAAQTDAEAGQMRLYIQELEARIRDLTGENERLRHELQQAKAAAAAAGLPATSAVPGAPPAIIGALPAPPPATPEAGGPPPVASPVPGEPAPGANSSAEVGAPPIDLGTVGIPRDDPSIAPDGATAETAEDGIAEDGVAEDGIEGPDEETDDAAANPPPPAVAALPGRSREAYDAAYGYVLTGDFARAETSLSAWIEANSDDPLADDARYWLGEAQFRQNEHREAAATFLDYYKRAGTARKAPSALVRLGESLAALGERQAACGTLGEVARKHPDLAPAIAERAKAALRNAGC